MRLSVIVMLLVLGAPKPAAALSCSDDTEWFTWPGSDPAPTTTSIWMGGAWLENESPDVELEQLILNGPLGREAFRSHTFRRQIDDVLLDGGFLPAKANLLHWLRPERELAPGPYELTDGTRTLLDFEVELGRDVDHSLELEARGEQIYWGTPPTYFTDGDFLSWFQFKTSDEERAVWIIKSEDDSIDLDARRINLSGFSLDHFGLVTIGATACGADVPGRVGDQLRLSFGSLDMSGNFSGWTDPVDVRVPTKSGAEPTELPSVPSTGCTAAGRPGLPSALMFLALLFWHRRRWLGPVLRVQ